LVTRLLPIQLKMLILRQQTTYVRRSKTFERIVKTTLQHESDEEKSTFNEKAAPTAFSSEKRYMNMTSSKLHEYVTYRKNCKTKKIKKLSLG
jgi:hypothetical protein